MKLEVGRVYVLVDEKLSFFEGDSEYRRLVKLLDFPQFAYHREVEGFCCDSMIEMVTTQTINVNSLKPASEKQRAMYNKKKKDILIKAFNKRGYWL